MLDRKIIYESTKEEKKELKIHKNLHNSFPNEMIWKPEVFNARLAWMQESVAIYDSLIS